MHVGQGKSPEDEYQFFYSEIDGFTFEPGYTYELASPGRAGGKRATRMPPA